MRVLARQKALGVGHERAVILFRDVANARRRAPLDLVLQARAGAAVEHRIRAVAQQEYALQLVERAVHGTRAGEGAKILALGGPPPAMFAQLRKGMVARQQDIGKAFIVAQQHVVARFQLLDQVLLQQQRLGFGARGQKHHRPGFIYHPGNAGRVPRGPRVVRHPRPQVPRLAHIQHFRTFIQHAVDARRIVQNLQIGLDTIMPGKRCFIGLVGRVLHLFGGTFEDDPILCAAAPNSNPLQPESCPRNLWITWWIEVGGGRFFLVR